MWDGVYVGYPLILLLSRTPYSSGHYQLEFDVGLGGVSPKMPWRKRHCDNNFGITDVIFNYINDGFLNNCVVMMAF